MYIAVTKQRSLPIYLHKELKDGIHIGVWQIIESEFFFRRKLDLIPEEIAWLDTIKGSGRRKEWLASRWLLHMMSARDVRGACLKDEHGKPYLENSSHEISMSHSNDRAAVMAYTKCCGIDIQKIVPKITRLVHKFCSNEEQKQINDSENPLLSMHYFWGAKECMFKAYGKKSVDFKKHMTVNLKENSGVFENDQEKINFVLNFELIEDYTLVYAVEE